MHTPAHTGDTAPLTCSIVIPARGHGHLLPRLLDSVRDHAPGERVAEVFVVDDDSEPPLAPALAAYAVCVLRLEPGQGPAAARNHGAARATGDVLLFLDADVTLPAGCVEKALCLLERHPEAEAVSFINQAYEAGDGLVANYGAAIEHFWFTTATGADDYAPFHGFTTRNGAVRRSMFEALGGFDTTYSTNAMEDYEFGKRISNTHTILLTRSPHPDHRFPAQLGRLVRNYFVRAALYVGYYLRERPTLDKVQTSPEEARTRMLAGVGLGLLGLGLLGLGLLGFGLVGWAVPASVAPAAMWLSSAVALSGVVVLAAFYYRTRRFLYAAYAYSGRSIPFVVGCAALHLLASLAILAGGLWGLARHVGTALRTSAGSP